MVRSSRTVMRNKLLNDIREQSGMKSRSQDIPLQQAGSMGTAVPFKDIVFFLNMLFSGKNTLARLTSDWHFHFVPSFLPFERQFLSPTLLSSLLPPVQEKMTKVRWGKSRVCVCLCVSACVRAWWGLLSMCGFYLGCLSPATCKDGTARSVLWAVKRVSVRIATTVRQEVR